MRSWTERPAKPGRAELEWGRKRVHKLSHRAGVSGVGCYQEIVQLLPGLRIRVLLGPTSDCAREIVGESRRI
jgi:hypothetical protein